MNTKKSPFWTRARQHLQHSNMTYWYHCWHSFYNGTRLLWLVITSYIHGIFPWLFKFHAAHGIMRINEELIRMPHLRRMHRQIQREYKDEQ
jgi:hypothetical protein